MSVGKLDPREWSVDESRPLWVFVDEYTDGLAVLVALLLLLFWNALLTLLVLSNHGGGGSLASTIGWSVPVIAAVLIAEHTVRAYLEARRAGRGESP